MVRRAYPSLKAFLEQTGTTQEAFAAQLGIRQSQLSKYVNGKQQPRKDLALRIAALASIPLESLWPSQKVA
jgi:transcriptional regulator with XRE-family HTH domain